MALPSSGTLELSRIANTDGANSVGVVTPYTLGQLTTLAGVGGYWDGGWFWGNRSISAFYNYAGYGFKYGSPAILHDFGLSSRFPTNSSSIIDTSGNGRTGTFVTGTGNGTAVNVTGYTQTYPAKISTSSASQYAIRLDDIAKYGGTQSFTWLAWFRNTSFTSSYNGIIAAEGRSGNAIGQTMYISNASGYFIRYERFNGTSGSLDGCTITFGSGGVPAYVSGKWYMAALSYNGSTARLSLFVDGTEYSSSVNTSVSVTTSASWGCFAGLRYNMWLSGELGYVACYSSSLNTYALYDINAITRLRYE
jgi:hypothetical protein